eukprot:851750-Prymnesium_polylepis.1
MRTAAGGARGDSWVAVLGSVGDCGRRATWRPHTHDAAAQRHPRRRPVGRAGPRLHAALRRRAHLRSELAAARSVRRHLPDVSDRHRRHADRGAPPRRRRQPTLGQAGRDELAASVRQRCGGGGGRGVDARADGAQFVVGARDCAEDLGAVGEAQAGARRLSAVGSGGACFGCGSESPAKDAAACGAGGVHTPRLPVHNARLLCGGAGRRGERAGPARHRAAPARARADEAGGGARRGARGGQGAAQGTGQQAADDAAAGAQAVRARRDATVRAAPGARCQGQGGRARGRAAGAAREGCRGGQGGGGDARRAAAAALDDGAAGGDADAAAAGAAAGARGGGAPRHRPARAGGRRAAARLGHQARGGGAAAAERLRGEAERGERADAGAARARHHARRAAPHPPALLPPRQGRADAQERGRRRAGQ